MKDIESADSAFLLVGKRRGSEFSLQAVDDQPSRQLGIEVGRFPRHSVVGIGDCLNGCPRDGIQQKRQLIFTAFYLFSGLIAIRGISEVSAFTWRYQLLYDEMLEDADI